MMRCSFFAGVYKEQTMPVIDYYTKLQKVATVCLVLTDVSWTELSARRSMRQLPLRRYIKRRR